MVLRIHERRKDSKKSAGVDVGAGQLKWWIRDAGQKADKIREEIDVIGA